MDEQAYKTWWQLHLRASRGECLDVQEHAAYEVGLEQFHSEETLTEDTDRLRQLRDEAMMLDDQCDELQAKRQQLKQRIGQLEEALSNDTRRALGIED